MGSSRWSLYVLVSCLVLATAGDVSAHYPFVNDFQAFEWEAGWRSYSFLATLVDDSDKVTTFWAVGINHPVYTNFNQIYYRRFDSFGQPISEQTMVSDSSSHSIMSALFPGCNSQGKWALGTLIRWASPECWPGCPKDYRAWYSDDNGTLTDTGFVVGVEVEPNDGNSIGGGDVDSSGNFVIAWSNIDNSTVWCQLYDPNGVPRSDTIRVLDNTCAYDSTLSGADQARVGMTPGGDFVVVFQAKCDQCGTSQWYTDIFMRPYYADGTPKTNLLCATCEGDTIDPFWKGGMFPNIAVEDNGDFAISWVDLFCCGLTRVVMRRFDGMGEPKGQQIYVDSALWATNTGAWIAGDSVGNLVVTWQDDKESTTGLFNVMAQRYDTAGIPIGAKYRINDGYYNALNTFTPVAMNNNGLVSFFWREHDAIAGYRAMVQLMDLQDVGIYIHADANNDRMVNVSDAVFLISYIFGGGQPPAHLCLGDADGNGIVNISDAVTLIAYIFGGGSLSGECPK